MLKGMAMVRSFVVLILFQAAGTLVKAVTHTAMPGALIGMALLALWLVVDRKRAHVALEKTAAGLLRWLALLFVPAGAGIVVHLALLRTAWMPLVVGLVGSTLLTAGATAVVMQVLQQRRRRRLGP